MKARELKVADRVFHQDLVWVVTIVWDDGVTIERTTKSETITLENGQQVSFLSSTWRDFIPADSDVT